MNRISVKAPAKINLSLDVKHKRDDGYHEVEMIMTTIDLADRIYLKERNDDRIVIESTAGYIPTDGRNLAYQAAELLRDRVHIKKGVDIFIEKNIPVAAGLAGGSTDAAATLKGLNQLWNLGLQTKDLMEIGGELGSDIPFCVYGGTALATGRGEKLRPLPTPPNCWVVLAKPQGGVSTADVYARLKVEEIQERPDLKKLLQALETGDFQLLTKSLVNVMEPITFSISPEVRRIKEQMIRFGGQGVLMSGSGPTVYALVRGDRRVARLYNGLRGFCKEVYIVRLLGKNAEEKWEQEEL